MADSAAEIIDFSSYRANREARRQQPAISATPDDAAAWSQLTPMAMPMAIYYFWPTVLWMPTDLAVAPEIESDMP